MSSLTELRDKAIRFGATEFGRSSVKGKRFYVIYNNKKINFGSKTGSTFIDHGDEKIRDAWYARHSKIKDASGKLVLNNRSSASFWASRLLW